MSGYAKYVLAYARTEAKASISQAIFQSQVNAALPKEAAKPFPSGSGTGTVSVILTSDKSSILGGFEINNAYRANPANMDLDPALSINRNCSTQDNVFYGIPGFGTKENPFYTLTYSANVIDTVAAYYASHEKTSLPSDAKNYKGELIGAPSYSTFWASVSGYDFKPLETKSYTFETLGGHNTQLKVGVGAPQLAIQAVVTDMVLNLYPRYNSSEKSPTEPGKGIKTETPFFHQNSATTNLGIPRGLVTDFENPDQNQAVTAPSMTKAENDLYLNNFWDARSSTMAAAAAPAASSESDTDPTYSIGSTGSDGDFYLTTSYDVDGRKLDYVQVSDQGGTLTSADIRWTDTNGDKFSLDLAKSSYQLVEDSTNGTNLTLALAGPDGKPSEHKIVQQAGLSGCYKYSYQDFQSAMDGQSDDQDITDHTKEEGTIKGARLTFNDGVELDVLKSGLITGQDIQFLEKSPQSSSSSDTYVSYSVQFTDVSVFQTLTGAEDKNLFLGRAAVASTLMVGSGGTNVFVLGAGHSSTVVTTRGDTGTIDASDQTSSDNGVFVLAGNDRLSSGSGHNRVTALSGSSVRVSQDSGTVDVFQMGDAAVSTSGNAVFTIHSSDAGSRSGSSLSFYHAPYVMQLQHKQANDLVITQMQGEYSLRGDDRTTELYGQTNANITLQFGDFGGDMKVLNDISQPLGTGDLVIGGNGAISSSVNARNGNPLTFIGGRAGSWVVSSFRGHSLLYGGTGETYESAYGNFRLSGPLKTQLVGVGSGDQLYSGGSAGQDLFAAHRDGVAIGDLETQVLSSQFSTGEDKLFASDLGNTLMIAGQGNTSFILRGEQRLSSTSGVDTISLTKGSAGGHYTIYGFADGFDRISLSGYEVGEIDTAFGKATSLSEITLSDGSILSFVGLDRANQINRFVNHFTDDDGNPISDVVEQNIKDHGDLNVGMDNDIMGSDVATVSMDSFSSQPLVRPVDELGGDDTSVSGEPGSQTFVSGAGNGFAHTSSGNNTVDFSAGNTSSRGVVRSSGTDVITGNHGSFILYADGNASVTTESDDEGTLTMGDGNSTITLQGTDNLRTGSGDNDITVSEGAHADIQGGAGHNIFTIAGEASLTVHGDDTVNILANDATIFDRSKSLHIQVAHGLNLASMEDHGSLMLMGQASVSTDGGMSPIIHTESAGAHVILSGYTGTATVDASASEQAVIASSASLSVTTSASGDGSVVDMGAAGIATMGDITALGHDTITGGKGSMTVHASNARSVTTRRGAVDTLVVGGQGVVMDLQGNDVLDASVSGSSLKASGSLQATSHGSGNEWNLSGQSSLVLEGADHVVVNGGTASVNSQAATSIAVNGGRLDYVGIIDAAQVSSGILHAQILGLQGMEFILSNDGGSLDATGFHLGGSHSLLSLLHGTANIQATGSTGASISLDGHSTVMGGQNSTVVSGVGGVDLTTASKGNTILDLALQASTSSSTVISSNNLTVRGGAGVVTIIGTPPPVNDGSGDDDHVVVLQMSDGEKAILSSASALTTQVVLKQGMGSSSLDVGDEHDGGISLLFDAGISASNVRFTRSSEGLNVTLLDVQGQPTGDRILLKGSSEAALLRSLGNLNFGDGTTTVFSPSMIVSDIPTIDVIIHVVVQDYAGATVPPLLVVMVDGNVVSSTAVQAPVDSVTPQDVVLHGVDPSISHVIGFALQDAPDGVKVSVSIAPNGSGTLSAPTSPLIVETGHPASLPLVSVPYFNLYGVDYSPTDMVGANSNALSMFAMQPMDEMMAAKQCVAAMVDGSNLPLFPSYAQDPAGYNAFQLAALYSFFGYGDYMREAQAGLNHDVIGQLLVKSELGLSLGIRYDASDRTLHYDGTRGDIVDTMLRMGAGLDDLGSKVTFWTSAVAVVDYLDKNMFTPSDIAASMSPTEMVRLAGLGGYLEVLRKPQTLTPGQYLETRGGDLSITYSNTGNVVSVGDGNYLVVGGAGNDLFRPGSGYSTIDLAGGHNSLTEDVNYTTSTIDMRGQDGSGGQGLATLGDGSTTIFRNVQDATSARGGNVMYGDSQANVLVGIGQYGSTTEIHGGGGNDVIFTYDNLNPWLGHVSASAFGDDGDDIVIGNEASNHLEGGPGDDIVYGNGSDDVLVGGQGNDILDGGWGYDIADYSGDPAPITADMALQVHTLNGWAGRVVDGWGTVDSVVDVERLIGTSGDDVFKAGQPDITFVGGDGSDTYAFRPWSGNMGIVDSMGSSGADVNVLQLQGIDFNPTSWAMTARGNDAVLDFGTGHTVTLWGQHANGVVAGTVQRLEFQDSGVVFDLRS